MCMILSGNPHLFNIKNVSHLESSSSILDDELY